MPNLPSEQLRAVADRLQAEIEFMEAFIETEGGTSTTPLKDLIPKGGDSPRLLYKKVALLHTIRRLDLRQIEMQLKTKCVKGPVLALL